MNIFRTESDTNDDIENIKTDILQSNGYDNEDIQVQLKGYMHNNTGFVLTVNNIEKISDDVLDSWKQIIVKRGYRCDFTYDFHDGWVDIRCTAPKKSKRNFIKASHLQQMGYLSVLCFSIYMLWQKHNLHLE